jgi:hypothetical protein
MLLRTSNRIAYWAREVLAVFIKDVWTMDRFGFLKIIHAFRFYVNHPFCLIFEPLISLSLKRQYDCHISFNLGLKFLVIWSRWAIGEDSFLSVTTSYCAGCRS